MPTEMDDADPPVPESTSLDPDGARGEHSEPDPPFIPFHTGRLRSADEAAKYVDQIVRAERSYVRDYEEMERMNDPLGLGDLPDYVRDYFEHVAGVPASATADAGWRVHRSDLPDETSILVPCRKGPGGPLLAVRALGVEDHRHSLSGDFVQGTSPFTGRGHVELAFEASLAVSDVPYPCHRGLFDENVVWVTHDPVDVLLLRSMKMNAVALHDPCGTLGSLEGLHQLEDLGALTRKRHPKSSLIVVDPWNTLSNEACGRLNWLYRGVFQAPTLTGPRILALFCGGDSSRFRTRGLPPDNWGRWVQSDGDICEADPVPVPARRKARKEPGEEAEGKRTGRKPPVSRRASETGASGAEGVEWLVEGLVPVGTTTDFQGESGAGKTVFLIPLMAAVVTGSEFMGRSCPQAAPVVLMTEQNEAAIRAQLAAGADLETLDDLYYFTDDDVGEMTWAEKADLAFETCQKYGARLAVFDTFTDLAGLGMTSSDAAVRASIKLLKRFTRDGIAVICTRHSNQGADTRSFSKSGGGSGEFVAATDNQFRLRVPDERLRVRRFDFKGRYFPYTEIFVALDDDGRGWEKVEEPPGVKRTSLTGTATPGRKTRGRTDEVVPIVVKALKEREEPWAPVEEIVAEVEVIAKRDGGESAWCPRRSSVDKALQHLMISEEAGKPVEAKPSGRGTEMIYRLRSRSGEDPATPP